MNVGKGRRRRKRGRNSPSAQSSARRPIEVRGLGSVTSSMSARIVRDEGPSATSSRSSERGEVVAFTDLDLAQMRAAVAEANAAYDRRLKVESDLDTRSPIEIREARIEFFTMVQRPAAMQALEQLILVRSDNFATMPLEVLDSKIDGLPVGSVIHKGDDLRPVRQAVAASMPVVPDDLRMAGAGDGAVFVTNDIAFEMLRELAIVNGGLIPTRTSLSE